MNNSKQAIHDLHLQQKKEFDSKLSELEARLKPVNDLEFKIKNELWSIQILKRDIEHSIISLKTQFILDNNKVIESLEQHKESKS